MSPMKPTRDDATRSSRPGEMDQEALAADRAEEPRWAAGEERPSRGGVEGNRRHPPHVTENAEGAPLQGEQESPTEVEPLPPNASGRDEVSVEQSAQEIDPESAYDRRPGEDKDSPPSSRAR